MSYDRILFTDGGASPNPGPGGWGVVSIDPASGETTDLSGGEKESTNNRMELTAAIKALESLALGSRVQLVTDSKYLRQGMTEWLPRWIDNGWKRKVGKKLEPVKNEDLWRRLHELEKRHQVTWSWIKGHAGHEHNERADELATREIEKRTALETASQPTREPADFEVFLKITCNKTKGAWAAQVDTSSGKQEVLTGRRDGVSANQLDLEAAAAVLEHLPRGTVAFHTGSDYLRRGATEWVASWKRSGWTTKAGTPVQNRALWQKLDDILRTRRAGGKPVTWPKEPAAKETLEALYPIAKEVQQGTREPTH